MGKINKFSNLYDKDNNLIRKAPLKDYSIEELEELVDKLAADKDENGRIRDPKAFNNASALLFRLYQTKGNPHEKDLIDKLNEYAKSHETSDAEVKRALGEINEVLENKETQSPENNNMEEYIDYEEVK